MSENTTPCGGVDNEDDGCTTVFPRMTSGTSLCNKCRRIKKETPNTADYAAALAFTQCAECGISGTLVTNPCGTCGSSARKAANISDVAMEQGREQRSLAMNERFAGRQVTAQSRQPLQAGPSTSLDQIRRSTFPPAPTHSRSAEPQNARPGSMRPPLLLPTVLVLFKVQPLAFRPTALGAVFAGQVGTFHLNASSDFTMRVFAEALRIVNNTWEQSHVLSLHEMDCTLRLPPNVALLNGDMDLTTAEFLKQLGTTRQNLWVASTLPTFKSKQKYTYLNMEIQVDWSRFTFRTGEDGNEPGFSMFVTPKLKSKRGSRANHSLDSLAPPAKRANRGPSVVLQTMFAPNRNLQTPAAPPASQNRTPEEQDYEICFKIRKCIIDSVTSTATIQEEEEDQHGTIAKATMPLSPDDIGVMKDVYKMTWNEKSWVAKKIVTLGPDRPTPMLDDLDVETTNSLILLKLLDNFLKKFTEFVRHARQSSLISEFQVSDGFIANLDSWPVEHKRGLLYLVEPLRSSTTVRKFTGTMGQTTATDKASATIAAFTHWVIQDTACNLCFSDIQGTKYELEKAQGYILFDPMAHSLDGDMCVGDHGIEGLETFIEGHSCSKVCIGLGLVSRSILRANLSANNATARRPPSSVTSVVASDEEQDHEEDATDDDAPMQPKIVLTLRARGKRSNVVEDDT